MLQITHTPLKLSLFLWCLSLHWFDGLHIIFSIMRTGLYRCVCVSEDILRFIVSKMNGIAWIATLSMFHMAQNPWVRRCYAMPRANSMSPASAQFSGSNKTALFTVILGSFKLRKQRQYPRNTCYEYLLSLPFSFSVFLLHCYSVLLVSEILSNPFLFLASY